MKDHRGRPKANDEAPVKFDLKTDEATYKFDRKKHKNAPYVVVAKCNDKPNKPKLDPKQKYLTKSPVVVVYKALRKNAKIKMKVFNNKNIDDVLTNKQAGIPENAEYLEVGVGVKFIEDYKAKYKI